MDRYQEKKRRRLVTSFKKTSSDDVFLKVVVTTFKKSSLSDNICNVVHRVIDVDCACWHDLTVTVSLPCTLPTARGQQNTATTGHLSVLKPLNPSTPMLFTIRRFLPSVTIENLPDRDFRTGSEQAANKQPTSSQQAANKFCAF